MARDYNEGWPKTKRINNKVYKLEGVDLSAKELRDLKLSGYSVRNYYNKMFRERATYRR